MGAHSGPLSIVSGVQVTIGRDGTSSTRLLNSSVSNVSIYNRALSPLEIQQNYKATRARFTN